MSLPVSLMSMTILPGLASGPVFPDKPAGRRDVQITPIEPFVLATIDRVIARHTGRNRNRLVARPERIGARHPRPSNGVATADVVGEVCAEAGGPPRIGGCTDVPANDMDALHRATPHADDM